jgi:dipeptidyl aminopeptidase/acylaminoacyl peptidase
VSVPTFAEPGISPDHSEIAFVSGGDIWTVPSSGGVARLLVSNPANDTRPLYSPDGKQLAFMSTRSGGGDIYVLTFASGDLRRVTFDDASEQLDAWSPDGRWLYFSSSSHEIAGMNDVVRVSSDGGTPMPVSADRYTNEYWAAPAPNGGAIAITARGTTFGQWWRNGRSHLDESEIWILRDPQAMRYERVSAGKSKDTWPMWTPDGRTLYYVSDRDGPQNIVRRAIGSEPAQITRFTRRPRAVADDRHGWPHDRIRARLRYLDARHGDRRGEGSAHHAPRGAGGSGRRTPNVDERARGNGARTRWQEGGVRRSRGGVRNVRARRRQRHARDFHVGARATGDVGVG